MSRPMGVTKRPPLFLPAGEATTALMGLPKARLAELVFDLACIQHGEEAETLADPTIALYIIANCERAIATSLGQKPAASMRRYVTKDGPL